MLIFPRDVFKAKGKRHLAGLLCVDQAAYDKALKDGWFATGVEAIEAFKAPIDPIDAPPIVASIISPPIADDVRPSRAELEAEAKRLGVKLDSRNSDERLAERIMEAHAAADAKDASDMDAVAFQRSNS